MRRSELISKIRSISRNNDTFDGNIQSALSHIGSYAGHSRIQVFFDNQEGSATSVAYEWCNDGISPCIDRMQNIPYKKLPSIKSILSAEGHIHSGGDDALHKKIIAAFKAKDISSLAIYPIYTKESITGFICFAGCGKTRKLEKSKPDLLKTVTEILSAMCERRIDHERLSTAIRNYEAFFNTMDEFILIGDPRGNILYANDAVKSKLGYSSEELSAMRIMDLHPKESRKTAVRSIQGLRDKKTDRCVLKLELEGNKRQRIPVETRIWLGNWNRQECIFELSKDLSREHESLQEFTKLFENNPAPMAITNFTDRKYIDVNEAFIDKFGYSKDEILGKTADELGLFEGTVDQKQALQEIRSSEKTKNIELQVKCKRGKILTGLFSKETIEYHGIKSALGVMVDITEQYALRKELDNKRRRLNNIIEATRLGTWEWNVKTGETIFNERWAEIVGYTLEELSPVSIKTWEKLAHPEDLQRSTELLQKHFERETDYYNCEARMKHKNGNWVWVRDRGKVIEWDRDGNPQLMFGTHADITERKEMEGKIRELSIRDSLTNAYNRRYIMERLKALISEYVRKRNSFTISMIDIDHFKRVNDTYGHQTGDSVLTHFTSVLFKNFRSYDLIGRYGGEEFIVISMNVTKEQTQSIIERFKKLCENTTFVHEGHEITTTFSCGITESNEHDASTVTAENIIETADRRLYEAKNTGRDRVVISD